jgi:hypothetical protein
MSAKISACGNDCSVCPRYLATQSGNPEELEMVAELWFRLGWRDKLVSVKDIACKGCKPTSACKYHIAECVFEKGISNCSLCEKFPCEKINQAIDNSAKFELIVQEFCTISELSNLQKAFFHKKENLKAVLAKKELKN